MSHGTNHRKFVLPSINEFQRKLEDFYQSVTKPKQKAKQDYTAYIESICQYYEKGMSLREISAATGVGLQTIAYWIKKKGISRNALKKPAEVEASSSA